jgi:hypothetical protein
MMLFDRSRAPFDAKLASELPDAKLFWPLAISLTPGADRASEKMFRLPMTGNSATRVWSKRTPTSAFSVLMMGASARTSTTSLTDAGRISTLTTAVWLSASVRPERTKR